MPFCSKCGTPTNESDKFCMHCGTPVAAPVQPEPVAPVAPVQPEPVAPVAPVQPEPVVPVAPVQPEPAAPVAPVQPEPVPVCVAPAEPVVSGKDKALGFVGMGLAILGLFFACIGILYTMIGMSEQGFGFGMAFAFSLFSLPLSIVGGVLCGNSYNAGNRSTACSVGSKLRIAGIIVSAVMLFLGFVNLFV